MAFPPMTDTPSHTMTADASPQERYRFKPFYGSSHTWALEKLATIPVTSRVLDVGPGSGAVGRFLRERGVEGVDAVEIDERARTHVAPIYRRVEATIDPFINERYDTILLLDVIEHMTDPASFLLQVTTLLAPGGIVLISVPNIAHWTIRLSLLFGYFEYRERGPLDKTHYSFFTRRRLLAMTRSIPHLAIEETDTSISPLQFLVPEAVASSAPFGWFAMVRLRAARLLPGLFAYQLLLTAKRR